MDGVEDAGHGTDEGTGNCSGVDERVLLHLDLRFTILDLRFTN